MFLFKNILTEILYNGMCVWGMGGMRVGVWGMGYVLCGWGMGFVVWGVRG